jgi:hypothetical protein
MGDDRTCAVFIGGGPIVSFFFIPGLDGSIVDPDDAACA